ncbi:unnamed protein product [Lactuca virosa]|uniref:Uncharacterized protein n=1 Tax=Lactuca virosa TaxID=75947 RepID=A0AAU9M028_9ASTR|nr:unnamed protein product [Lactuca virosa]
MEENHPNGVCHEDMMINLMQTHMELSLIQEEIANNLRELRHGLIEIWMPSTMNLMTYVLVSSTSQTWLLILRTISVLYKLRVFTYMFFK